MNHIAELLYMGILGREIAHALGKDPKQWKIIHALSRSQKEKCPSNVKYDYIDFTNEAKETAEQLKGVEAEYDFLAAYFQKDPEQENYV